MHTQPIHPAVRVGHVHLRVADLDRALAFYRDALGFGVTADGRAHGLDMVLLAAGDYHHHVGLNTWDTDGGPPPPGHTGLYHVAFLYPDRRELGRAVQRLLDHGHPVDHGTDHGGTVSVYLSDPDGNGVELYYDRPRDDWFDTDGHPVLKNERFDPRALITTPARSAAPRTPAPRPPRAEAQTRSTGTPPAPRGGHGAPMPHRAR
jgi:catechol 2,3-dioxygenase